MLPLHCSWLCCHHSILWIVSSFSLQTMTFYNSHEEMLRDHLKLKKKLEYLITAEDKGKAPLACLSWEPLSPLLLTLSWYPGTMDTSGRGKAQQQGTAKKVAFLQGEFSLSAVLRIELRAMCIPGRCATTSPHSQPPKPLQDIFQKICVF